MGTKIALKKISDLFMRKLNFNNFYVIP